METHSLMLSQTTESGRVIQLRVTPYGLGVKERQASLGHFHSQNILHYYLIILKVLNVKQVRCTRTSGQGLQTDVCKNKINTYFGHILDMLLC